MILGPLPEVHMFSHIVLGTNDLDAAIAFYDRVMATLGFARHDTATPTRVMVKRLILAVDRTVSGSICH